MPFSRAMSASSTLAIAVAMGLPVCSSAMAQDESSSVAARDEIIVSARKRKESAQDVPVVLTAIGAQQLKDYNLTTIQDISTHTPQLLVSTKAMGGQGVIGMRGVTTGGNNNSGDQAVAINVDGMQISHVLGLRMGQLDLQQVEILKGPQALFFGKNSPGGVISLLTADPTDEFFMQLRAGYEFKAEEKYGEVVLSGPITDTLGFRGVFYASSQDGPFTNVANEAIAGPIEDRTGPDTRDLFGRITLKFEPDDAFDAKLKVGYSDIEGGSYLAGAQNFNCPNGTSVNKPSDDCILDDEFVAADPPDEVATLGPLFRDGKPYEDVYAFLTTLEMNYEPSDVISLTSMTGFFDTTQKFLSNLTGGGEALLPVGGRNFGLFFSFAADMEYRAFSQELRLNTNFDGPLNFMLGGYVDDTFFAYRATAEFATSFSPEVTADLNGRTYSGFGQAIYDITDTLELAGGLRYTYEQKSVNGERLGMPFLFAPDEQDFENLSPEATLTWRPTRDVTLFGAYKQGYKSGGWNLILSELNAGLTMSPRDIAFDEEKAKGGEIGLKTNLFDGQVQFNAAAYRYNYSDLQVTIQPVSELATPKVVNAGEALVQGVELDASWSPPSVEGLTFTGALAYNDARYKEYTPNCYRLQTAADGCTIDNNGDGTPETQDLEGALLERAPQWNASAGFSYDRPVSTSGMWFRMNSRLSYSSWFWTEGKNNPLSRQDGYVLVDASIALYSDDSGWDLAFIGRNLTNKIYAFRASEDPISPAGSTDLFANVNTPRQLMLQLTLRPSVLLNR